MKKVFNSPMGVVEYDLVQDKYTHRLIIVDGKTVGGLEMVVPGARWLIAELVGSPLFASQTAAAKYWLMWLALKERAECPYCSSRWEAGPVFMDQDGASSVVWTCPSCDAVEEHKRWPPPQGEEGE